MFASATRPSATTTSSSSSIPTIVAPSNPSPSSIAQSTSTSSTISGASSTTTAASGSLKFSANNTGAIVGGVIGGLAFIFLAGSAIFFLRLWSKRHPKINTEQDPMWNDGSPNIQLSRNHEPAELSGELRLVYELPGERESVHIELDSRSFHEIGVSWLSPSLKWAYCIQYTFCCIEYRLLLLLLYKLIHWFSDVLQSEAPERESIYVSVQWASHNRSRNVCYDSGLEDCFKISNGMSNLYMPW